MTVRDHLGRSLAVGGALAVLGIGGITMTERALAVAPVAPANAADTVLSAASAGAQNNQAIPDATQTPPITGPVTPGTPVTSTITIGQHGIIRDADVQTFLRHAASGDVDITVTSPKGTVVTLVKTRIAGGKHVSGPAGTKENVYNGTVWDDQAPASALTATYSNFVVQPSLVPEGALGAFVGEEAFGTWTLTVQDQLVGDTGQLDSWKLNLTTDAAAPSTTTAKYSATDPKLPIHIGAVKPNTYTSTFTVSGAKAYLWNVDLITNLPYDNPADLEVTLSHAGRSTPISLDNSGPFTFMDGVTWSDQPATPGTAQLPVTQASFNNLTPNRMTPEGAMAAFAGTNPNGDWTLTVKDTATGGLSKGDLNAWALNITSTDGYPAPVVTPPTPPAPGGGGSTGIPLPKPQPPKLGVTAFSLLKARDAITFKLGWVRGTGPVAWNVQLSTKLGKRTVVRRVKGSLAAGSTTITRTVRIPRSWKGHRVTAKLVITNGTTTIVRTKTLRV